jgi:hypothetical protein
MGYWGSNTGRRLASKRADRVGRSPGDNPQEAPLKAHLTTVVAKIDNVRVRVRVRVNVRVRVIEKSRWICAEVGSKSEG